MNKKEILEQFQKLQELTSYFKELAAKHNDASQIHSLDDGACALFCAVEDIQFALEALEIL